MVQFVETIHFELLHGPFRTVHFQSIEESSLYFKDLLLELETSRFLELKNMFDVRIEPVSFWSKRVDCGSSYQIGVFLGGGPNRNRSQLGSGPGDSMANDLTF